MPGNAAEKQLRKTYAMRTNVGSNSKYSAIPPHTPAMSLSFDFVNLLFIMSLMFIFNLFNYFVDAKAEKFHLLYHLCYGVVEKFLATL